MVLIIDYGAGNIGSVVNMLRKLNIETKVGNSESDIIKAEKLILPGVGSFSAAMDKINGYNTTEALNEAVLVMKKPILGICLGAQLINSYSEEGNVKGLGWLDNTVNKFNLDTKKYKIPHLGWNNIEICQKDEPLLDGLDNKSRFYFVHSYHISKEPSVYTLALTNYGYAFPSIVRKDNIYGVQFHPEKSHRFGLKIFENFVKL